jgi:hypothetical protein
MGATAAEIRELCLLELRECQATADPAHQRYRAERALMLAQLARIRANREAAETGNPEAALPPVEFIEQLNGVLANLAQTLHIDEPPSDGTEPPRTDFIV